MEKFIIDDRIFTIKFSCDVGKCKGACCTLKGAGGAPLLNEEVQIIKRNIKTVEKYLSENHIEVIEREGFLVGEKDDYSIVMITGNVYLRFTRMELQNARSRKHITTVKLIS